MEHRQYISSLQNEIITALQVHSSLDATHEIQKRTDFLASQVIFAKAKGLVLGISGGQDSSLAGKLCQRAVEQLRSQGHEAHFYAVTLPYGVQQDAKDVETAMAFIQPDHQCALPVEDPVDAMVDSFNRTYETTLSDFNKGNVKARMRMVAQYTIASHFGCLVVGTDHAAEAVTGFYTKFGDGAADVMPLAGLTKHQGAQLLQALGSPDSLWEKVPTADLLDGQPGRPDEEELGVSYRAIDTYLTGGQVSEAEQARIEQLYNGSRHKRAMPATPDV